MSYVYVYMYVGLCVRVCVCVCRCAYTSPTLSKKSTAQSNLTQPHFLVPKKYTNRWSFFAGVGAMPWASGEVSCGYICSCMYIYIHMCICIFIHTYTYIHIYVCMYICIHIYICVYINT